MRLRTPSGKDVWLIGDPHLGKVFQTGVPLNRRGERERLQKAEFVRSLDYSCDINICVGDLFDRPSVGLDTILFTIEAYITAARRHPETLFVIMAGNHDISRQHQSGGAFHILAKALERVPNIIVALEPTIVHDIVVFPWQWEVNANDQVHKLGYPLPPVAVGHWDLCDFDGNTNHLVPAQDLYDAGVTNIYSGHYHVAGNYDNGVICTGSMQPYAHGEDPDNTMYITLTLDELEGMDKTELRDINVRLVLPPGIPLPEMDCLSLVSKREGQLEEVELEDIGLGDFNLSEVLQNQFVQLAVPESVQIFIMEKLGVSH